MKGALIILLVFAHFRSALNRTDFKNDYFEYVYGWNSIFTCFYMPAFFLISGYCSNFRKDPKTFLKSLLKSLVLPLFALSLVNDTMYALMVTHQDISTTLLKTYLAFMQTFSHTDFTLCNMQLSHKQILQNIMVIAIGKRKKIDFHEK